VAVLERDLEERWLVGQRPQLVGDVELLGEFTGSGFTSPRFLVRRADQQVAQLSPLLYRVVEQIDGTSTVSDIADRLAASLDRPITGDNICYLVSNKLHPLGLATLDEPAELTGPDILLGLRAKKVFVSARTTQAAARRMKGLFDPTVVLAVVLGFVAFDVWAFSSGQLLTGSRSLLTHPSTVLIVLAALYGGAVFHEFGHASACAYGGATPGVIGGGFYLVYPALYTNVTDSYRLDRAGRVRTDLGGIYFNAVLALVLFAVYLLTGWMAMLLAAAVMNVDMLSQMLPFVRFDGYWLISDLAGIPDLFGYLRPAFTRIVFPRPVGRHAVQTMRGLKPSSRRVLTLWAGITVVVLAVEFAIILVTAPAIARATFTALEQQVRHTRLEYQAGGAAEVALGVINVVLELLFFAGLVLMLVVFISRAVRNAVRKWGTTGFRRVAVSVTVVALFLAPMTLSATHLAKRIYSIPNVTAPIR